MNKIFYDYMIDLLKRASLTSIPTSTYPYQEKKDSYLNNHEQTRSLKRVKTNYVRTTNK